MLKQNRSLPHAPASEPMQSAIPGADWSGLADLEDANSCANWLSVVCTKLSGATTALLQLHDAPSRVVTWPAASLQLPDLKALAERAASEQRTAISLGRSGRGKRQSQAVGLLVAVPISGGGAPLGVVAVALSTLHGAASLAPEAISEQIQAGAGWLWAMVQARRANETSLAMHRATSAMDVLALAGSHTSLTAAATAVVNELAARLECDRVSLGIAGRGDKIKLLAMSQSAGFRRQGPLVQAMESAMEEAVDQKVTVAFPVLPSTERAIARAHQSFLRIAEHAQGAVITVPLLLGSGQPIGALLLERRGGGLSEEMVRFVEVAASLFSPYFALHLKSQRLISGRVVDIIAQGARRIAGPNRPALKLAVSGLAMAAVFLLFAEGEHRVASKAALEGQVQRAVVAPFEGFIRQAPRRAGDVVRKGDLLAALDDKDLILDRAKWSAERDKLVQQQRDALAKHDRPNIVILKAQIDQAEAQLALAEEKLARSKIGAPFDGVLVSGDLSQTLGAPVDKGKLLFEVAPLDAYRLVIHVDERDVAYVHEGQRGRVALTGMPGERMPFVIQRITPVTVAEEGQNTFRIEAGIDGPADTIRPGMEGIAKIDAGQRKLLWIWTHATVNWLRLTLWKYLP